MWEVVWGIINRPVYPGSWLQMFNRRRYNRKPGRRKAFRPRIRRKGVILRPTDEPPPPKIEFDASGAVPYLWQYWPQAEPEKAVQEYKKLPSLRYICSRVLAENADALEPSYLTTCSWTSCWKHVWRVICQLNLDLPHVFRMFAKHFGSNYDFKCHHVDLREEERSKAIMSLLLSTRRHRIDNVFSNISYNEFVCFVSGVDAHVILDCSSMKPMRKEQVLNLCKAPNLAGLDISSNEWVDDQFLYTLGRAISSKNSSKMKLLRIVNCLNITQDGLRRFLQDTLTSLTFLSTDIMASKESNFADRLNGATETPIGGTQWRLLHSGYYNFDRLVRYKLIAMALYLLRNSDLVNIPSNSLIWDIRLFPDMIDSRNPMELYRKLKGSWAKRESSSVGRNPYLYIRSETSAKAPIEKVEETRVKEEPKESDSLLTERVPKRKPKIKMKNADALFGIK